MAATWQAKHLCLVLAGLMLLLLLHPLDAQTKEMNCGGLGVDDLNFCRDFMQPGKVLNPACCEVLKTVEHRSAGTKPWHQAICECANTGFYETRFNNHVDELLKHCGVNLPLKRNTDCDKV